jgi:hypothetical protein
MHLNNIDMKAKSKGEQPLSKTKTLRVLSARNVPPKTHQVFLSVLELTFH